MKRAFAALLGLALTFGTGIARADDRAVEDAAKSRYAEGVKLYNKKKYEEARAAFLQAIALRKRPAAVMMLAESALKSGRWLEAMRNFEEFEKVAAEMPPKLRQLVDDGKKEARSHLGRLTFDVPEGAEVTIDGEKLEDVKAGKETEVAVGTHTIVVTHRDEKKTLEVQAEAGKTTEVHPSFVPKAIIPTETRSRPKAPTSSANAGGTSTPEPEAPGFFTPPATKWPLYALGAVGIGGLATAAIFGGISANANHGVEVTRTTLRRNAPAGADCGDPASFVDQTKGQDYSFFQGTCEALARQQRFANTNGSLFTASMVVGIAGIAGAITWFFVAPKEGAASDAPKAEPPKESTLVIPWGGLRGGGVMLERSF